MKEIEAQINYFKDDVLTYSALTYSEIIKNEKEQDYQIDEQGFIALKTKAGKRYKEIQKYTENDEEDLDTTRKNDDDTNIGENLFFTITVIISIVFVVMTVIFTSNKQMNTFQFIGAITMMISINILVVKFMNIMNGQQKYDHDGMAYDTLIQTIENISELSSHTELSPQLHIFFKQYQDMKDKSPSFYIKMTKHIDDFLNKQSMFMKKSENIGLKNGVFNRKVQESLNFFNGKNTIGLAREYIIINNKNKRIREANSLKKYLDSYEDQDFIKKNLSEDTHTYKSIFSENGKFSIVLNDLLKHLSVETPDVDNVIESIVITNKYLNILEHIGLPEYRVLKYELLYKNSPELFRLIDRKDRYRLKDEIEVVDRFKRNLESCGDKALSVQSEYVNDTCSSIKTESFLEKTLQTYAKIISDYSNESNEIQVNRISTFIKLMNDKIVSKRDMTSKMMYEDVLENITIIIYNIFKYSNVTKADLLSLYKKTINTNPDTVSNVDIFVTNIRKVLDVIFTNLEDREKNHLIASETIEYHRSQEYITYDQFSQKIIDYEDIDYVALVNQIEMSISYIEKVVEHRSENSIDNVDKKKLNIFKEMIFCYIISSFVFLLDYLLKTIGIELVGWKSFGNTTAAEAIPTQKGGSSIRSAFAERMLKKTKDKLENATGKIKDFGKGVLDTTTNRFQSGVKSLQTEIPNNVSNLMQALPSRTNLNKSLLKISTILSGWIFSVIVLYTYWMKMNSNLEYNMTIKKSNSLDLIKALIKMKNPAKRLSETKKHENENKKELYDAIINLLSLESKCNLVKFSQQSIPFPMTEIILTLFLIFLCVLVIISQNLLNNPFDSLRKIKLIKKTQENKDFIVKRMRLHNIMKNLIYDALFVKVKHIDTLSDKDENLLNDKKALQEEINDLNIDQYNSSAIEELKLDYPKAYSEIKHLYDQYDEYANKKNHSISTINDIDFVIEKYKKLMTKFKQNEFVQLGGYTNLLKMIDRRNRNSIDEMDNRRKNNELYRMESMKEVIRSAEEDEDLLQELNALNDSIVDMSDSLIMNLTISFSIIMFTIFVSYKLINSSIRFKSELFNGKLFGEGMCYN